MNIYEATKKALAEGKCMRMDPEFNVKVKVEAGDVCTLMRMDGSRPSKGWEPSDRELLSEEWEVVE